MVDFSPTEPWLYLVIYAGFMVFVLTFGLALYFSRKKKAKQKTEMEEEPEQ